MFNRNNFILIWSVCLVIIGLISSKFLPNSIVREANTKLDNTASVQSSSVAPVIDESFYENTDVNNNDETVSSIARVETPIIPKNITPAISAKSYLAGDIIANKIYIEKNVGSVLPVASMSKLITAFAVTDMLSTSTIITITPEEFDVPKDASKISAGESFTVEELLYPLLLSSSNVAAEALASSTDRNKFLQSMMAYSWEVGMPKTRFADPSGVSPRNVSTASDFFGLARYLYLSRPDILAYTKIPMSSIRAYAYDKPIMREEVSTSSLDIGGSVSSEVSIPSEYVLSHEAHDFINIHPFVNDPDFMGGKTGHTPEAKDTMLTIMKIKNHIIAVIVIGSDDRKTDTQLIIEKMNKLLQE